MCIRDSASEPGPKPRTAAEMVDDLDRLLSKAGISGPYVVVGHSYGGLLMRLFAVIWAMTALSTQTARSVSRTELGANCA